jgi:antitoxin component of MazEF toxin-antitoxin module
MLMNLEGRLVKHGDNLALVLDPEMLKQMNINLDTKLEIVATSDSIIVSVSDEEHRAKLHQIMDEMNQQYGKAFKRLAE